MTVPPPPPPSDAIGLWDLEPKPWVCPHGRDGKGHRSLKAAYRCLGRTGVPGFRVVPRSVA